MAFKLSPIFLLLGFFHSAIYAQSSVRLYGIVDMGIRTTTNKGVTQMLGGGMAQSRWGIDIKENLGSDLELIAGLQNRVSADTGSTSTPFFQNSWIGLHSNTWGRITLGRQFNTTFDLMASTYASFPYLPYMEAYKPELGFTAGARNNNMIKYVFEHGAIKAGVQYAFGEKGGSSVQTDPNSYGGYLRWSSNGWAIGAAHQILRLPGETKVTASTLGGSYTSGPWYFNAGFSRNTVKDINVQGATVINAYWNSETSGGFRPGSVTDINSFAQKRVMYKMGVGYQITPSTNLGMHYYHADQSQSAGGKFNAKADFFVMALHHTLSKRTSTYLALDHTRLRGGDGVYIAKVDDYNVRRRTGATVGLLHRF